jgi:hypothetical protein
MSRHAIRTAPGTPGTPPALERMSVEPTGELVQNYGRLRRGILSPPALSANVNNYAPTGLADAHVIRLITNDTNIRVITGIDITVIAEALRDGREFWFQNVGVNGVNGFITFAHDSASSNAGNRFLNGGSANFSLAPQGTARAWYDGITDAFRAGYLG